MQISVQGEPRERSAGRGKAESSSRGSMVVESSSSRFDNVAGV